MPYPESVKDFTFKLVSRQKGAFRVSADEKMLKRYLVRDSFDTADEGWYYNLSDRTIMVKYHNPENRSFDVKISTEKFDLIGMAPDAE